MGCNRLDVSSFFCLCGVSPLRRIGSCFPSIVVAFLLLDFTEEMSPSPEALTTLSSDWELGLKN